MSKIKSTRASELISYGALSQEYARTKCGYALVTTTTAREAVIIAEQEAEERHEQQLQELRDRAVDMFKDVCSDGKCEDACGYCDKYYLFTHKLNEK